MLKPDFLHNRPLFGQNRLQVIETSLLPSKNLQQPENTQTQNIPHIKDTRQATKLHISQ